MQIIEFILHIDQYLKDFIINYDSWAYAILFLIIFVETGVVVMPFLPGDALLFAVGMFAGNHLLNIWVSLPVLLGAAVLGDASNYLIGKYLGNKLLRLKIGKYQLIKSEHLEKTHHFFEKHGTKTIVIARFVPIVRTLAPFVAGIGKMHYSKFGLYNCIGAFIWVLGITFLGYFLGSNKIVSDHFEVVILTIIFISVLPMLVGYVKHRLNKNTPE